MRRKFLLAVLIVIAGLVIWNWSLLVYGVEQGMGQLKIVWYARPVGEVMTDPEFPDSLKSRLLLIEDIRKFAIDSLGLKDTKNYKTVFDQQGKELMWVVTASEPFELKPKLWHFPVIGTVPYKGYFNKEKAKVERDNLEREGWDVSVRNPGGWSTLGWFTDPILSGMLNRSEGDLASLILHEMVHATLWVKDSVDFNENLATFIGDTAAYDFLTYKFGKASKEYSAYLDEDRDYRKFSKHMLRGATSLDSLYKVIPVSDSLAAKKKRKEDFIRRIVTSLDTIGFYLAKEPSKKYSKRLPNNAFFLAFRHYQSRLDIFKEEFNKNFKGDLKSYVTYLSTKYPVI
jgi:predicted aminopeptidase